MRLHGILSDGSIWCALGSRNEKEMRMDKYLTIILHFCYSSFVFIQVGVWIMRATAKADRCALLFLG